MAGKLDSWGVIGAIHPGGLVHVVDSNSGASYLVDTGSTYSILPYKSHLQPTGPLLKAANGRKFLAGENGGTPSLSVAAATPGTSYWQRWTSTSLEWTFFNTSSCQ